MPIFIDSTGLYGDTAKTLPAPLPAGVALGGVGILQVGDGSVATPTFSFANSTGLGFFRKAANSLGIAAAGLEVGSFTSAGAWTLGSSTLSTAQHLIQGAPTGAVPVLDVEGNGTSGAYLRITEVGVKSYALGLDDGSTTLKLRADNATGVSMAELTPTGAWTLGPAGFAGTHTLNGAATIAGTATFNGPVVSNAAHLGGYGLVPAGFIGAYNPGYYTNGANAGFAVVGPAGNTVAQVNAFINAKGWYVCDGAAVNVASSPIWNAAGRFLPKLDDSRFLLGSTTAGVQAGVNSVTLVAGNIPSLTSAGSVTSAGSTVANNTGAQSVDHSHGVGSLVNSTSGVTVNKNQWNNDQNAHTHGYIRNTAANVASGASLISSDNAFTQSQGSTANWNSANATGTASAQTISGSTAGMSVGHTHSIPSLSVNSGQSVSTTYTNASPSAISSLPQYLSTYYIVRVF